jgi:hypothetical protein
MNERPFREGFCRNVLEGAALSALAFSVSLGSFGCGLVSSDVTSVPVALPSKTYTFNTASSGYKGPPGTIPAVSCGDGQLVADCCNPAPGVMIDCAATPLVCESSVCTYHTTYDIVSPVNLQKDAPDYSNFSGRSLLDLKLKTITYTADNMLNVPSPEITIWLAPDGVTHSTDAGAVKFGTVAPVPAGASKVMGAVVAAPGAAAAFGMYAQNPATPFNFIAAVPITVKGGDPIPSGTITVTVSGEIQIQPNL